MHTATLSTDPASAGIRRVGGNLGFSGYLLKCLLLCHLHLLRGESEGGGDGRIYVGDPTPIPPRYLPLRPLSGQLYALQALFWIALACYGTTIMERIVKIVVSGSLQPCSERALAAARAQFSLCVNILLWGSFWITFEPPSGVSMLYDSHPGGT